MEQQPRDISAVVWNWRTAGNPSGADPAREAAAARRRGLLGLIVGLTAATLIFFWKPVLAGVVAAVSILLALIAFAAPLTLHKQVTRGLDAFARGVGLTVTWVLMTVLYYVLFLPVGLLLRARRRLGITRSPDPALATYWKPVLRDKSAESYRKQF